MVGETIGHYHIDAKVGEGEFSTVYKGHDIRLDRTVAVKVLKERHDLNSYAWGRLLHEARIASTLNHPNICTLYDIGEEQDVNYVVFEFVEGSTLWALLKSGPLPIRTVFEYGMQIAEAMIHTHGAGILQRDLKSANIMVTPAGRVKVIDFGLATIMQEERVKKNLESGSSVWEVGWIVGTLSYMAPELLRGAVPTVQAGVWSLGVVMFEMLTGELPFAGNTPFELGMDIMTKKCKPLPADIPGGLRAIVYRCLVRNEEHRYYSAVEFLNHLRSEFVTYEIRRILANRKPSQDRGFWFEHLGNTIMWLFVSLFGQ